MKKLDIKQWEGPIFILLMLMENANEISVHVEDIAIQTKKKFPLFFSWSKYKSHIDLRQVMRTMDKLANEGFVIGSNTTNWTLTKKGINYGSAQVLNLGIKFNQENVVEVKKSNRSRNDFHKREIIRLQNSDVFVKYLLHKNFDDASDIEIKYLIKMDHYSDKERVIKNISLLYIAVRQIKELTKFLDAYVSELLLRKIINRKDQLKVEQINE
tara:strand:- start:261 stop:899 length:639 start_codon:yes stop_codon:yes gene_type:complete